MLEITESGLMAEPVRAEKTLHQLHAMGIRLSIDDFSTGHSSLAYLKDLPMHELKIDQSFVLNMSSDETQTMIVRTTIGLAHNLGLTTTAEGVETQAVWDQLEMLNCDVAQGYFISQPLAAADFKQWLKETTWQVTEQA
jgi:EAL domain-containing protein (putative c-di-GMP-specific phosphodiesterase class I)